jgi:hypothetical protein
VRRSAQDFLDRMPQDPDTMRLAMDEDESIWIVWGLILNIPIYISIFLKLAFFSL